MYKWEGKTTRGRSRGFEREIPSFSSSLLNEIYRSIDKEVGADRTWEQRLYPCSVGGRKKSKCCTKAGEVEKREPIQRRGHGFDRDAVFFSSTSSSSDLSSNGFSSSDTESRVVPSRLKPVRVRVSAEPDKTGTKTEFALFHEQRKWPGRFDGKEEMIVETKSRARSFYSKLMNSKHPISPGGKLASFINSLFATNVNVRKPKLSVTPVVKSGDSSASSFSRSCLSKYSPMTIEKLRDGAKRTVRFHPVSVILDEDSRPCGQKLLNPKEDETRYNRPMERSSQVKEAAIEFLRNYSRNQKRIEETVNATVIRSSSNFQSSVDDDVDRDDDAASCTSSDLFELDDLDMLGNGMYCEELPVYETTHVRTNGAIASTMMM